jgi:hypothetical protein
MTSTVFVHQNVRVESVDSIILDTGEAVRALKKFLINFPDGKDIFEHTLLQVFEYVYEIADAKAMIKEFCNESCDIVYSRGTNEEARSALYAALYEFATAVVDIAIAADLVVDGVLFYTYQNLVGDDIVVGYNPDPKMTIEPGLLSRRFTS